MEKGPEFLAGYLPVRVSRIRYQTILSKKRFVTLNPAFRDASDVSACLLNWYTWGKSTVKSRGLYLRRVKGADEGWSGSGRGSDGPVLWLGSWGSKSVRAPPDVRTSLSPNDLWERHYDATAMLFQRQIDSFVIILRVFLLFLFPWEKERDTVSGDATFWRHKTWRQHHPHIVKTTPGSFARSAFLPPLRSSFHQLMYRSMMI